jgi:signal peptidase I
VISSSRSRLSYKDRRSHQKQRFRSVGVVFAVLAVFLALTEIAIQPWRFGSESMAPGYPPGTCVLVRPYLLRGTEGGIRRLPERGELVAVHPPYAPEDPWHVRILDPLLRLFTLQKASIAGGTSDWEDSTVFKRIIGIPGDTIKMEKSVAYVRGSDDDFFLSEFEMSGRGYDLSVPELPEGWDESMPLSGEMDELVLNEGEYFLLGDNRSSSNDSRYWGPVDESAMKGHVLFAYWPLRRFGLSR